RFAPSPTGPLHIGGVRTALFNYLFAKKHNGKFILRIEDTDQARYVAGAEDYLLESLEWCGIVPDEGVNIGGDYGPYRQSERKESYNKYVKQLVEKGYAYYAFDTSEELEKKRKEYESRGETFTYNAAERNNLSNSLSLSADEVKEKLKSGIPYTIRFKIPVDEELVFEDVIRGRVIVNTDTLDDKVLFKADGMPTYHLANVVDDHLMKISHVIRGEEWLPSLPLHVLLYRSFGWEAEMPEFAHMPLTLKPDGKGKLSKRDGDLGGFPVFPLNWTDPKTNKISKGYKESGYFPEAFVNIIALLGWNPGTKQEIFSMDELIETFSLEKVGKAGARFDPDKAKWFNHYYLQKQDMGTLADSFKEILEEKRVNYKYIDVKKVVELIRERANFVSDFWDHGHFFFKPPEEYDPKAIKKNWIEDTPGIMKDLKQVLSDIEITEFTTDNTEEKVKQWINKKELSMGKVMNPFRLSVVGALRGPHLFDIIDLIGKKETLHRIDLALKYIEK
ncbi:MAG: glutamate--tRNA ligase, partial [Bacteroidales bacterium]|nr:glutamate--tRNA ligase [Bacteroidales bacterium]